MSSEMERWTEVDGFPDYLISNFGRAMNRHTEAIKVPTPNQQGIPNILLIKERKQYRRALPLLVAHHFVPKRWPQFDTPINVDGDRFNNYWRNLQWRPLWFAQKYHRQFHQSVPFGFDAGVISLKDEMEFANVVDCAKEYGLLMKDIIHSCHTQTPVFPTWQTFAMVQK